MTTEKETPETPKEEIQEEETPTQETVEDKLSKLEERLAKAESLAEEKDKGFRTLQQKYDRLYKSRTETPEDSSGITKKLTDEIEQLGKATYQDDPNAQARIIALKSEVANIERDQARKAQLKKQESLAQEARDELEDKIRDAGYDPDDENFDSVWDKWELASLADGKFERAENKLSRILSKMKPKEEEKKPVEDEEKMRERIKREILEEYNLNPKEKVKPKGSSDSDAQIRKNFRENPGDPKALREYAELQAREGK